MRMLASDAQEKEIGPKEPSQFPLEKLGSQLRKKNCSVLTCEHAPSDQTAREINVIRVLGIVVRFVRLTIIHTRRRRCQISRQLRVTPRLDVSRRGETTKAFWLPPSVILVEVLHFVIDVHWRRHVQIQEVNVHTRTLGWSWFTYR